MVKVLVDGVPVVLVAPDLNLDGVRGGVEVLERKEGFSLSQVVPPSDLGDSLREINKDSFEDGSRMSGIDLRSRLHIGVIAPITALDALVWGQVYPDFALKFTRQWKRNCVSLQGLGRAEHVDMVAGKRTLDAVQNRSLLDRIKDRFGGDKK